MAPTTSSSRFTEGAPFRNDPQSMSIRVLDDPEANDSRKQSPSSLSRYIRTVTLTWLDMAISEAVEQVEPDTRRAIVAFIG